VQLVGDPAAWLTTYDADIAVPFQHSDMASDFPIPTVSHLLITHHQDQPGMATPVLSGGIVGSFSHEQQAQIWGMVQFLWLAR
jgi:hypothetical protein